MGTYLHSCIKLFAVALPMFCLLSWTWCSAAVPDMVEATASAVHLPQPSTSAILAADALRGRGYSLFAAVIVSLSIVSANFSGTILASPDFAFSSAATMFLNNRRHPPRPSVNLLLYHTLKPPLVLTWTGLSLRQEGDELHTLYNNNCLYVFKSPYGGDVIISSSPFKNPLEAVQVRQPDLYVDQFLTVHGIDGVLDPSYATKCRGVPAVFQAPRVVNRTFLDQAIRRLRRSGYLVVAAAMAVRRLEILSLTSVTVLAVPDRQLFLQPDGFRYNFRHHVVPERHRITDLVNGTQLVTLDPLKNITVYFADGMVTVDGVPVRSEEVYHSMWIVVISIARPLDGAAAVSDQNAPVVDQVSGDLEISPLPFSGISEDGTASIVPPPAPPLTGETESISSSSGPPAILPTSSTDQNPIETPSPAPDLDVGITGEAPSSNVVGSPSPAPVMELAGNPVGSPAESPAGDDDRCANLRGIEGGDLLCQNGTPRRLQETEDVSDEHVERSEQHNAYSQIAEDLTEPETDKFADNVNIADDIFYYS